jgi:hypothetical protein
LIFYCDTTTCNFFYEIAKEKGWIHSLDFKNYSQFSAVSRNEELTKKEIARLRDKADEEVRKFFVRTV